MKKTLNILFLAIVVFTICSCTREDDIDEIFIGKTWYMTGATINGLKLNSEVKNFYTDGRDGYYIIFSSGTFQGVLSAGTSFAGTWSANGKKHSISLNVTQKPSVDKPFDKQIYNIISSTTFYTSGADFLQLEQDGQNKVFLGNTR